jgi:anti-sigma regulatory factor (Ser/Thr protein kinase)
MDQAKIVTAASELARNTLIHGGRNDAAGGGLERPFP